MTVRLSKDQRNKDIGVLMTGSMVIDIAYYLGCSRKTIHNLVNPYDITGSVRARARPGHACMTTLRHYRVNTLIRQGNRLSQQPLLLGVYGVHAQKIFKHFMQNNGPGLFQHDNARPHTKLKWPHYSMLKITSTSCLGLLHPQS